MKRSVVAGLLCIAVRASAFSGALANDIEHNARKQQEFAKFNPHYAELKAERVALLRKLAARVAEREAARQSTACSHEILWELKTLVSLTANFAAIDSRMRDLASSLDHPEGESAAEVQNPEDGSFGGCYEGWHLKLMASYERYDDKTTRPFRFLDRVNSPEKLTAYLTGIATSDIAKTGVDHTYEFNESLSDLMRLILHDRPNGYPWDPRLKQTLTDLLMRQFRNPETGWWGEKYIRDGRAIFVDDLSMTFHTVSYLDGKVTDLPRIADTALALKNVNTPAGWLYEGAYWNHNNMDVAVLFRYAWPEANAAQRAAMKAELEKMLAWCLADSFQPDGSFKPLIADGSLEEATYFGAVFLARIGYFDRARRFWTDAAFPDAESVRAKLVENIREHIRTGGAGGLYYKTILEELQ